MVTVIGQLLPKSGGSLAAAAATLTAAALLRPLLVRARRVVDCRCNRERYSAVHALEQFAGRVRGRVNSDDILDDRLRTLELTVQPASSGIWVKEQVS